jgi:hypothetical protein
MMGRKPRIFTPVLAVSLDALVPADHFYRHVERVLDLSFVRELVQDCYVAGLVPVAAGGTQCELYGQLYGRNRLCSPPAPVRTDRAARASPF